MKTIFVSGNFNILHPGHLRLLRFASELGDKLIVAINNDKFGGDLIHVSEQLRLESILSISWVNEAFILHDSLENTILNLKPDYVVKGKEHENNFNIEEKIVKSYGGKLVFCSGEAIFSSLDLIRKNLTNETSQNINIQKEYLDRHNIDKLNLTKIINKFSELRVCVIGDLIIDEYIACEPLGMSQEDPTIVVRPIDSQKFIGGAGIVAAHAASLGAKVNFISLSGNDDNKNWANNELISFNVKPHLLIDEIRPTTLKQRYRARGKTLLRVSHLHQNSIDNNMVEKIISIIEPILQNTDLLIFSDFNYGCITDSLLKKITDITDKLKIIKVADSQCSSQTGDISRFKNMDLITPTELESRVSLKNQDDGLVVIAEKLRIKSNSKNIILKLGAEGALLHFKGEPDFVTDKISALNNNPKDVAGAGDSLLATASLTLTSGGNLWEAALLGSIAASIQVSRIGNVPLKVDEILNIINNHID